MNPRSTFKTLSIAAALALMTACASTPESTGSSAAYDKALAEAKTAQAAAKKVNNQWFYKEDLIKQAEKAAAAGDYANATKLAEKAKFQGDMAVKQAAEQKNAGPYPTR
ncbi:MAG TPA: hypothetical protein ENO09_07470 [bacterium]|nr:hypothetical protein [bacterium]